MFALNILNLPRTDDDEEAKTMRNCLRNMTFVSRLVCCWLIIVKLAAIGPYLTASSS